MSIQFVYRYIRSVSCPPQAAQAARRGEDYGESGTISRFARRHKTEHKPGSRLQAMIVKQAVTAR